MLEEAKRVFKPELLNRFDDIIVFRQLGSEDVVKILDLEVAKVRSAWRPRTSSCTSPMPRASS